MYTEVDPNQLGRLGKESIELLMQVVYGSKQPFCRFSTQIGEIFTRADLCYFPFRGNEIDMESVRNWLREQLNELNCDPDKMQRFILSLLDRKEFESNADPDKDRSLHEKKIAEMLRLEGYKLTKTRDGYQIECIAQAEHKMQSRRKETVNITVQNVALLNAGQIKNLNGTVSQTIQTLHNFHPDLAEKLDELKSAVTESKDLAKEGKVETLDRINVICEEAVKPADKRQLPYHLIDQFRGIGECLKGTLALFELWKECEPLVRAALGI